MINYEKLKQLRTTKKIPLQEMADALEFKTAGGYSRIESGENKLKAEHLPIIADKFGISLTKLMKEIFFDDKVDECSRDVESKSTLKARKEVV